MGETVVLVVDRDEHTRLQTASLVREQLAESSVVTADSVATAADALENEEVDVVVTGYDLDDGNGLVLADHIRETSPGTGCILYTHSETVETESFEDVVVEFVGKETPDAESTLVALIEQAGPEQTQAAHPVPDSEERRLDAAERIEPLRNRIAPAFETIAALARDHFGGAAGAVTLILRDEHDILAESGPFTIPTVREDSLATHTITSDEGVMVVPDTQSDPRFTDTDEIHAAGIRSYLGVAIRSTDGDAVGALSVYDDSVREFTEAELIDIRRFGDLASEILLLAEGGKERAQ